MAEKLNNISPKGCVDYANQLIELCKLPFRRIVSIQNINSNFLASLFECITGLSVPDLLLSDDSTTEVHNIQAVIDTLSLDLLDLSLSHITGEDIASGDIISILNLLEVFEAVFLHLNPHEENKLKEASSIPSEDNSTAVTSNKIEAAPLKSVSSSDETIPSTRLLKRKTCRKTLRKSHKDPYFLENASEASQINSAEPSHSKRHSDNADGLKSSLKRKILMPSNRTVKRLHTESIETLHNLNFEKKVRALLHCEESPIRRAQQMKKNYVQSLKTPLKRTPMSPCKKSFLLPHNLRHKRKSSVSQSIPKKKTPQKKKSMKCSISENTAKYKKDDDLPAIIQSVMEEFPGFKFSKNTLNLLINHYYQHVGQMHKQLRETLLKKPTKLIQAEKAMKDQNKLSKILNKDLKEKNYLKELKEHKNIENKIKYGFRDERLRSAKTRQYFDEFQKSMSRKLQKRNFSEEVLIEKTFKEMLNLQKEKVRVLCQKVKEADEQDAKQHRQYLEGLENLYQQQLALLAESINTEQKDSLEREKAQERAEEKMSQEFRKKLVKEVRCLQQDVLKMIEDIHFRELDAQNFIQSFQQQDS